jgi:hypothetical protein
LEFVLRPTDSRPVRLGIFFIFSFDNYFVVVHRASSLTRGRVCSLQCNRWLVRSLRTNNHTLQSHLRLCSLFVASGVGVLLAADSQATSSSGYWASLWDPWPDFSLVFFLRLIITLVFFLRRLPGQENGSVVYSAVIH